MPAPGVPGARFCLCRPESREQLDPAALWCLELAKLRTALALVAATAVTSDDRECVEGEVAGRRSSSPRLPLALNGQRQAGWKCQIPDLQRQARLIHPAETTSRSRSTGMAAIFPTRLSWPWQLSMED